MQKPPCSTWSVWTGLEIEGNKEVGAKTMFIRRFAPPFDQLKTWLWEHSISRVWICKEMVHFLHRKGQWTDFMNTMKEANVTSIAIEATLFNVRMIPLDVFNEARIYLKITAGLKPGDQICVGRAFHDEAFEIGSGVRVTEEQYGQDTKLI